MRKTEHCYGPNVHILDDPYLNTLLTALCVPSTGQPQFNDLIRRVYEGLIRHLITGTYPRKQANAKTRMATEYPQAILRSEVIDPNTSTVVVDIARAGILPSQVCFDLLNGILTPNLVRQDHLIMARKVDDADKVVGATISGSKIGGEIGDRVVLFPDPMGATGGSLATAIEAYLGQGLGRPSRIVTMNLIVTPEFVKRISEIDFDVEIYALRLDRAMSSERALSAIPGTHWDEESGLSPSAYIIPGGGGFGELMNNSWV